MRVFRPMLHHTHACWYLQNIYFYATLVFVIGHATADWVALSAARLI
jgi:hypothetical protein